jgi:hypothetical protein
MAKVVKKKDIASNLADAASSIKNALGWKDSEALPEATSAEAEVEMTDEEIEAKKKKAKGTPRKAFSDFAESYRKEIGK